MSTKCETFLSVRQFDFRITKNTFEGKFVYSTQPVVINRRLFNGQINK